MSPSSLRVIACGAWAAAVLDHVEAGDAPLTRRIGRLRVADADADPSPSPQQPERLALVTPTEPTFRAQVAALADPRRLAALLPAAWLADPAGSLARARTVSARQRSRMGLLAAETRLRARLSELVAGAEDIVLVGAPDEALACAGLMLLGAWTRDAAKAAGARLHLLMGLDPLGPRADANPAGAARLHAFLCELEAARSGGASADQQGDPFDRVLLVGRADLGRADLAAAAAEALGWWARTGSLPAAARHPDDLPPRWRGRSTRYACPTALTAALDTADVAREQAFALADVLARRLAGGPSREPLPELDGYAERIVGDVHRTLRVPSDDEIARAWAEPTPPPDPALATTGRLDKELERVQERADRAVAAARSTLFGGAIQRMSGTVESGQLDLHVAWLWGLVTNGRATLDDTAGVLLTACARLTSPALERGARDAARGFDETSARAEKRRREGANSSALAALHGEVLRVARLRSRLEAPLLLLGDARESLGRLGNAMAAARLSAQGLPRVVASLPRPRATTQWQARIRLDPDAMRRALGAEDLASAWMRELAAASAGDPSRGLGRAPDLLAESLVAFVARRIEDLLKRRPVTQFQGLGSWLDGLVSSLPPAAALDAAALPRGIPPGEAMLLAGADEAESLQPPLSHPATLGCSRDPARVGWVRVVGPVPLLAIAGLRETRRALEAARLACTLLPFEWEVDPSDPSRTRFREPSAGDLLDRVRGTLAARGADAAIPAGAADGSLDELLAALRACARPDDDAPSLRQAAALAAWDGIASVTALAGLEPLAQEAGTRVEPDGSDAELLQAMVAVMSLAEPLKKALESAMAQSKVTYLLHASAALDHARPVIETRLAGLERRIFERLVARWRSWIDAEIAALRGRSDLVVRLRTKRLVVHGHARVLVEVENAGDHPAVSARVEILASPDFRLLDAAIKELGPLEARERSTAGFQVKPLQRGDLRLEIAVTWDDLESTGKRRSTVETVALLHELPAFRRIERNPYIAGPPVRSEEMFFGRDDIFAYIQDGLAGRFQDNILILHGQRRTGKSSILCQIERRNLLPDHVAVMIDLQGLGSFDTAGFLYQIARHAARRLARTLKAAPALPDRAAFTSSPYDAFQEHLDVLEDGLAHEAKRLLFMIDEFDVLEGRVEAGAVEPEVFPFLRNLMQHRERVAFVLAGTQQLVEMRHDYWSILFSLASYRKVSYLPPEAARQLVQQPLEGEVIFDDLAVDALLHLTAGHPYYLQLTCQNLVHHLNGVATRAYVTPEDVQQVLPEVMTAGSGHFEHEWRVLGSPLARCVLAAMAERDDTGLRWFAAEELAQVVAPLRAAGLPTRPEDVERTLDQLTARDVVEGSPDGASWRVRIDLFRHWVRRSHPLARAVAEAAESLG